MNLQDITTWTISADHKARPKNPFEHLSMDELMHLPPDQFKIAMDDELDKQIDQHTYACSPTLVAGDYPAEDVELVWQRFAYGTWLNNYTEPSEDQMFNSRQYLQLKQPVKEQERDVLNHTIELTTFFDKSVIVRIGNESQICDNLQLALEYIGDKVKRNYGY